MPPVRVKKKKKTSNNAQEDAGDAQEQHRKNEEKTHNTTLQVQAQIRTITPIRPLPSYCIGLTGFNGAPGDSKVDTSAVTTSKVG